MKPEEPDFPYADMYLSGRDTSPVVPLKECPCCGRGHIQNGICTRCHVANPEGVEQPRVHRTANRRRRADQSEMRPMADYVTTKQDHHD